METRSLLRVKFFDVSFSIRKRDEDMDASLLHMLLFNSFLTADASCRAKYRWQRELYIWG